MRAPQAKGQSESRQWDNDLFQDLILQAPVAMCFLSGPSLVVEIANARMLALWGKQPGEVINKPALTSLVDVRHQDIEALHNKVYDRGEPMVASERPVIMRTPDGVETRYIDFVYDAFRGDGGRVRGVMGVAIDVTRQVLRRRKIEEKEGELLNRVQQRTADLLRFTYAASHDMKEPIRKVLVFCDRLGESMASNLNHEQQHYLERIESAAKRMNFLIDDLLSYHEVIGQPPAKEWVDLNRLVAEVLADLDLDIEEKKAHIIVSPLFTLKAYRRQLQQVFLNLIGNALKNSKSDSPPEITISCEKQRGSDTGLRLSPDQSHQMYYVVSITDDGIGFDPEDADRIFNVFERLHHHRTHQESGLGLPIVRKAMENHDGFVTGEGIQGLGATFRLFFPAESTYTEQ